MNANPTEWTPAQQYRVAETLKNVLAVLAVLFLGFAGGYWMSIQRLSDAGCRFATAPAVCEPALAALNHGLVWCLLAGILALVSAAGMQLLLARVDL